MTLPHVDQHLIQAINDFLDISVHGQLIYDQRCHDQFKGQHSSQHHLTASTTMVHMLHGNTSVFTIHVIISIRV